MSVAFPTLLAFVRRPFLLFVADVIVNNILVALLCITRTRHFDPILNKLDPKEELALSNYHGCSIECYADF